MGLSGATRAVCLGGGPAGPYFAISTKLRQPEAGVVVLERNKGDDTFGWAVVLSDETLDNLHENDPISATAIKEHFAHWDDIAVHHQGQKMLSTGHGFCGIGRKRLLLLLPVRARQLAVDLRFETEVKSAAAYKDEYDVVVACGGLSSNPALSLRMYSNPTSINDFVKKSGRVRIKRSMMLLLLYLKKHTKAGTGYMRINLMMKQRLV